jgi:hypothetical protein
LNLKGKNMQIKEGDSKAKRAREEYGKYWHNKRVGSANTAEEFFNTLK